MIRAFRTIVSGVDQGTRYFGPIVVANLAATALSIPFLFLAVVLGTVMGSWPVLILTAIVLVAIFPSPAAAGLQNLAHGFAHAVPLVGSGDIVPGYRAYSALAFKAWLVSVMGTIAIVGNMAFYLSLTGPVATILRVLWIYVTVIWLGAHLYVYPLLIEQRVKHVFVVYRNALLMSFTRPIFTGIVGIVWLFVIVVTSVTGLAAIFGLGVAAAIQQNATALLLPTFDEPATVE